MNWALPEIFNLSKPVKFIDFNLLAFDISVVFLKFFGRVVLLSESSIIWTEFEAFTGYAIKLNNKIKVRSKTE